MSDLIDRITVLEAIRAIDDHDDPDRANALGLAEWAVKSVPTEQTETVRCRECKHYQFADNRAFGFPVKRCEWTGFEDVDDDDFCSRAERRADG